MKRKSSRVGKLELCQLPRGWRREGKKPCCLRDVDKEVRPSDRQPQGVEEGGGALGPKCPSVKAHLESLQHPEGKDAVEEGMVNVFLIRRSC